MKLVGRIASVSDRTLTRLLAVGAATLVIGTATFGIIYFLDQKVDRGFSLIDRQVESAEQAVQAAPGNIVSRLQLAQLYQSANRLDEALKQYNEILTAEQSHRIALLGRGDILIAKGDFTQAAREFQKIVSSSASGEFASVDPQLQRAVYNLGWIALKQARAKDAIKLLETAVKMEPTDADAWYLLGTANLKAGAPELAVKALKRALEFVPTGWCEPYTELSKAYTTLKRTLEVQYANAMVDFCQNRPADARRRLQSLTAGPIAVDAMLGLGMIAERESERQSAIGWYQKILTIDPKNFNANMGLSRLGAKVTK